MLGGADNPNGELLSYIIGADNAACEGFFGRLKTEMYYGRKWSGITPEKFMQQVDAL